MAELTGIASGVEIGGYRVEELIGRGGMGEVYRAHDGRLDRNVALKILAPRYAEDDGFRERLLRESRLAASLDHPNVVPVYDAGEADARLLPRNALRRGRGPERGAATGGRAGSRPGAGDRRAGRGCARRRSCEGARPSRRQAERTSYSIDGRREHCYLADFGLTQSASERGPADGGSLLGTLDYVAPEQIRGDEVDGRADVYALGCMLFECLTGEVPFRRRSEVATLFAHLEEDPPSASARHSPLPAAIDPVLARALAKEPDERQSSCAELVADASAALGLDAVRPRRLRLAVATAAAVLVLAAAALAAILVTREGTAAPPTGSLVGIDPASGDTTARYRVSAHPGAITTGAGRVWAG